MHKACLLVWWALESRCVWLKATQQTETAGYTGRSGPAKVNCRPAKWLAVQPRAILCANLLKGVRLP